MGQRSRVIGLAPHDGEVQTLAVRGARVLSPALNMSTLADVDSLPYVPAFTGQLGIARSFLGNIELGVP